MCRLPVVMATNIVLSINIRATLLSLGGRRKVKASPTALRKCFTSHMYKELYQVAWFQNVRSLQQPPIK